MNENVLNSSASSEKPLSGRTVLVTGGTGFIGGRLVEKLVREQGARVRVLVRDFARASRIARFPVEMVPGTISNAKALRRAVRGCSAVFHCACTNSGNRRYQWAVNVGGTKKLADAVRDEGVGRLVHVSSLAVYGKTSEGEIDETAPRQQWSNPYAVTKRGAEDLLLKRFHKQKLPVVILQPSIVYGPYSGWTVYPLEWLQTGRVVLVNGGGGLCNCVYVDDVVDALILAATRDRVLGETFLISSQSPVVWREFWEAYERMLGLSSTVSISEEICRRHDFAKRMTPQIVDRALRIARHPGVRSRLSHSRLVGAPGFSALRSRLLGPEEPGNKDIHWPDTMQIDQAVMQTRLKLDKAAALLGFHPRFDFSSGMAITEEWARWANLLPPNTSMWERAEVSMYLET